MRAGEQLVLVLVLGQAGRGEGVDGDVPGGALGLRPPLHLRGRRTQPRRRRRPQEGRGPAVRSVTAVPSYRSTIRLRTVAMPPEVWDAGALTLYGEEVKPMVRAGLQGPSSMIGAGRGGCCLIRRHGGKSSRVRLVSRVPGSPARNEALEPSVHSGGKPGGPPPRPVVVRVIGLFPSGSLTSIFPPSLLLFLGARHRIFTSCT
ncbi:hypothetical protein BS78_03G220600 [Paspalum vaginatum]|nr:hypothetical protein BS78_03G220600 [Paspalum vaginatum]